MKLLQTLIAVVSFATILPAQAACGKCGAQSGGQSHAQASLTENMEAMADDYKTLTRGLRRGGDPADADKYLVMLAHLQRHILAAKRQVPERVAKSGDTATQTKAYRADMAKLLMLTCRLEIALCKGDMEAASKIIHEMKDARSDGHEKFIEDE